MLDWSNYCFLSEKGSIQITQGCKRIKGKWRILKYKLAMELAVMEACMGVRLAIILSGQYMKLMQL